jgi:hypothetical protein
MLVCGCLERINDKIAHLVEVDIHALELEVRGAVVDTGAVETMLARDGLPEGGTNLVTLGRVSVFVSMAGFERDVRIDRSEDGPIARESG